MNIIVATNNNDKALELSYLLDIPIEGIKTLKDADIKSDPEETGSTFLENAKIKAYAARQYIFDHDMKQFYSWCILADDSGLCVDIINSEPGVYSARYSKRGKDYIYNKKKTIAQNNNAKLLKKLENYDINKRSAHFETSLVLLRPYNLKNNNNHHNICDYKEINIHGICRGFIGFKEEGSYGFGYDPIFFPEKYKGHKTLAQLSFTEKQSISHRADAIHKLKNLIKIDDL